MEDFHTSAATTQFIDRRNRDFIKRRNNILYPTQNVLYNIARQMGYKRLITREQERSGLIFSVSVILFLLIPASGIFIILHRTLPKNDVIKSLFSIDYIFFTGLMGFLLAFMLYMVKIFTLFRQPYYGKVVDVYGDLLENGEIVLGEVERTQYNETEIMEIFYVFTPVDHNESIHSNHRVIGYHKIYRKDRLYILYRGNISIPL